MRDDDLMDGLLRRAMAAETPSLTAGFDAAVMRRVAPAGSRGGGSVVAYGISAAAATAWLMSDLPPQSLPWASRSAGHGRGGQRLRSSAGEPRVRGILLCE